MNPLLGIGVLGMAAAGGVALVRWIAGEVDQQSKYRDANGWSLEEVRGKLVGRFDADGDGRIAFDAVRGAGIVSEGTLRRSVLRDEPVSGWASIVAPRGARVTVETSTYETIRPMLLRADTDRDGIATGAEIDALLRTYDANGDGRLSRSERRRALDELRAVDGGSSRRVVGISVPPARHVDGGPRYASTRR